MNTPTEPARGSGVAAASGILFSLTLAWGALRWSELSNSGTGGEGGFIVLGEFVKLILLCSAGVAGAWLLAAAAALKGSKAGVWLVWLETPALLYALYYLVLLFSS